MPKGIRRHHRRWRVTVQIDGQTYRKSFPLTTSFEEMRAWRDDAKATIALSTQLAAIDAKRLPPCVDDWCYVYFAQSGTVVKIGRSVDPVQRVHEIQTMHAKDLVLLVSVAAHAALEAAIHKRFEHLRTRAKGEWFRLEPDLVAFIRALQHGANPVALLFEDPRVILGWHLHPRPTDAEASAAPCPEN